MMILAVVAMGGCWDSRDIDALDICTAVVVDLKDGEYAFYCEVVNIAAKKAEEGGGQQLKTMVVPGAGESFAHARHDLDKTLNKPLYLGAVQSLIMTEEMADNGIEEYAYRVREFHEYRKTMDMIITPDNPEDILNVIPENSATVGFAIQDTLQNLLEQGVTFHMSLADVLQKLCANNKCYLLSTMGIKKNQITLLGYSVFDGGHRVGYIPYEQARGIIYVILGGEKKTPTFLYVANLEQGTYTLETKLKSSFVKVKWDGVQASFILDFDFEAQLIYQSTNNPVTAEVKKQIETDISNQLMADITQAIRTSMEFGCDYLSYSEPFRVAYPEVYDNLDWQSTFANAHFSVNLTVPIKEHSAYDYNPQ